MERNYKAFISYRHLPLEIEFAKKLHRRIEHYIIPKELRKDGRKKLGYVFRDQDELPLSSNLSSDIQTALQHSEFLIVICSPETEKSAWVLREIHFFLETHDRDHVLVMIVDGTSAEAIPSPLTDYYAEDGSLLARVEPLAANIAADSAFRRNRLFATESLRLIAAMIGCSYDELYKREQRYKRRRVGAAAALTAVIAAVFIGTLLNRNHEIRANYEQALRNQSRYLASESLKALEEDDRLSAIALAIEALPAEGKERPRVSEAEYALGCAVGAYVSPGNANGMQAIGMLSHPNTVKEFRINGSGTLLCSYCSDGTLAGWDLQGMKKLWTLSPDAEGIAGFLNDSDLAAWSDRELYCIDAAGGTRKWSVPVSALSSESWSSIGRVCASEGSGTVIVGCSTSFSVLDGESGSVLRSFPWPEQTADGQKLSPFSFAFRVSPDGSLLATKCTGGPDREGVIVLDLNDGSVRLLRLFDGNTYIPDSYAFTDDGRFFFSSMDLSAESAYSIAEIMVMTRSESVLHCEDFSSGETAWESRHTSSTAGTNELLLYDTTLTETPLLIYAYANHLDVLDAGSGTLLAQTEFSSRIVGVDIFNQRIFCVTENGERGSLSPADYGTWHAVRSFVDNLSYGEQRVGRAWVFQDHSNDIVCYGMIEPDPTWIELKTIRAEPEQEESFHEDDFLIEPGCIAFLDGNRLLLNDGDPSHPLREAVLPNDSDSLLGTNYRFDFYSDGRLSLVWTERANCGVLYADTATAEVRIVPWQDGEQSLIGICGMNEGRKWVGVTCREEENEGEFRQTIFVHILNEDLVPEKTLALGSFSGLSDWVGRYDNAGRLYVFLPEAGKCFCANLTKGTVTECGEGIFNAFSAVYERKEALNKKTAFSPDGSRIAVEQSPNEYLVLRTDGSTMYTIRSESQSILAVSFTPDGRFLLSVEGDGLLRRYRAADGGLLSRNELARYHSLMDASGISFRYTDSGFLALRVDSYMNLINMEDWGVFAYVPGCFAYLEDRDFFICYDYHGADRVYTGIRRYTPDTLIAYGQSILNGWELSDSQRMRYGLQ